MGSQDDENAVSGLPVHEQVHRRARLDARQQADRRGIGDARKYGSPQTIAGLEALLVVAKDEERTPLAWLREWPEAPRQRNLVEVVERLEAVRKLGVGADREKRIHRARYAAITRESAIVSAQHLSRFDTARRLATLAVFAREMEATAGAIDHVFGLCHLLGFRFAPRIRDLADRRLYVVDARETYKALGPVIGGALDLRGPGDSWDEVLRMAASIKAGTVAPSAILRRLSAYPRQNALAKALREIGRLERALFTLDWISDPALRRRTNAGLNKGEARNALARAVFFHRLGEIRDRTFENQRYRASGLNLAVAAIILWNTVYHRCHNERSHVYYLYGERGITVCERWRADFWNFAADMPPRPSPAHTIDRWPNNDGNYEPGNVRWATPAEQAKNRRDNHHLTINGRTRVIKDWARETGIAASTIHGRLNQDWPPEDAVTMPPTRPEYRSLSHLARMARKGGQLTLDLFDSNEA